MGRLRDEALRSSRGSPGGPAGQSPAFSPLANSNLANFLQYTAHRGFSPMDFGAVADGTNHCLSEIYSSLAAAQADFPFATSLANSRDRVALQKCFDLAKNNDSLHFGKNVSIPAGNYYLDAMLRIDTVYGMTVRGDGLATVLSWHGGAVAQAAIKIILSELCTFKHFLLSIGDGSHPPRGIWLTNRTGPSDGIVSTHAIFRHVRIVGPYCVQRHDRADWDGRRRAERWLRRVDSHCYRRQRQPTHCQHHRGNHARRRGKKATGLRRRGNSLGFVPIYDTISEWFAATMQPWSPGASDGWYPACRPGDGEPR